MARFRRWAKSWVYSLTGEELSDKDMEKAREIKEFEDRFYIAMAKVYGMV